METDMIFPDLPQRRRFSTELNKDRSEAMPAVAVTQCVEDLTEVWFQKQFPNNPAHTPLPKPTETPSFAQDPRGWIEFVLVILSCVAWIVFWKLQQ